ncbi:MAG: hypothetical protein AB7L84_05955 [Acidimicrobiia bacterium]
MTSRDVPTVPGSPEQHARRARRPRPAAGGALALVLLGGALLGACGDRDGGGTGAQVPDWPAQSLRGIATSVEPFTPITEDCTPPEDLDPDGTVSSDDPPVCTDPDRAPLGSVLVEEEPGADRGEKISFRIGPDTELRDGQGRTLGFDDLVEGSLVEVDYSGPVAESYPGQAGADSLTVLDP